ncbi:unnamed protein product [Gongylonema pulchrum]|uniref:Probable methylmalonate-semialdehyde/malonate-semialdehyde dehydrogenase [acylating], mitochondrial n=1 Tax=Gongylonema pulchrum TaxID=637853 RepID=A0A183ECN1_9BILA|nr:unnamed protein product [Gongylonema pulchrum]VDN42581.1 unnamed protein product [Gongylonema pulchrum]
MVEEACAATKLLMGENLHGLAMDTDTKSMRQPLGVCGCISPFNFPAMCSLWSLPLALVAGNTLVHKPSELDPSVILMIAELTKEAGIPDGCYNVFHGQHDCVNFICDNPDIRAISFVGGNQAVS